MLEWYCDNLKKENSEMNNNHLYYTSLNEIGKLYDFAIFKRRGKSHFYVLVCRQKKLMPKFQQPNCIDIIYIEVSSSNLIDITFMI